MDLKTMQAFWYQILKEEGFCDIEEVSKEHSPLKDWDFLKFSKVHVTVFEATQNYFRGADSLLRTYPFENETHRKIWELHAQGMQSRRIVKAIAHMTPCYKLTRVCSIIAEIAGCITEA